MQGLAEQATALEDNIELGRRALEALLAAASRLGRLCGAGDDKMTARLALAVTEAAQDVERLLQRQVVVRDVWEDGRAAGAAQERATAVARRSRLRAV